MLHQRGNASVFSEQTSKPAEASKQAAKIRGFSGHDFIHGRLQVFWELTLYEIRHGFEDGFDHLLAETERGKALLEFVHEIEC